MLSTKIPAMAMLLPTVLVAAALLCPCTSVHAFFTASVRSRRARLASFAQLYASGDSDAPDDAFMRSLQQRMQQVDDNDTKLPIVVLDAMLPRQRLELQTNEPKFMALIKHLVETESPRFGMVGMVKLVGGGADSDGQETPLQNGVEVLLEGTPRIVPVPDDRLQDAGSVGPSYGDDGKAGVPREMVHVKLRAERRIRIQKEAGLLNAPQGWGEARVTYLKSDDEEFEEEMAGTMSDPMSLARAMQQAREFVETPWSQDRPDQSLVDRWIELARRKERIPGQIDRLLEDLGEIPPATEPSERALWVGALINPLPGMGVAMEIRPQLLMARTAEVRVEVALRGILDSIAYMEGRKPLL